MKSRKVKGKRRQTERQKGEIINEKQLSYFSAGSFNNNNKLDPSTQSSIFHVFVGFNVESKINRRESILSSRREENDE